jgi:hypothetical protein
VDQLAKKRLIRDLAVESRIVPHGDKVWRVNEYWLRFTTPVSLASPYTYN